MKQIRISTFLLALFFSIQASAQLWNPTIYKVGKLYPGYIIELDGDTVYGFIEARERCTDELFYKSNQTRCEFYKNEKDKKPQGKYAPNEIKGYMIADKMYISIAYSGGLITTNNFCLATKIGRLTKYEWYSKKDNVSGISKSNNESWDEYYAKIYNTTVLLTHSSSDDVRLFSYILIDFADEMAQITNDYPEFATKVRDKEKGYKVLDFDKVIDEYNAYWATKEEE